MITDHILYSDESFLPICTLPMLHGKMYIINSPDLIISAMKNQQISFDPFLLEFSQGTLGLHENTMRVISNKEVIDELLFTIHNTLMGEPLYKMNVVALTNLMENLNNKTTIEVSDTYDWMWKVIDGSSVWLQQSHSSRTFSPVSVSRPIPRAEGERFY